MSRPSPVLLVSLAAALGLAACGEERAGTGGGPTVAATTTQAADLTRQVAGDRAATVGLLPPNADPHDYELRPRDVEALTDADLVVRSGGDLDEWLGEALDAAGADADTLTLIEHVDAHAGGHEHAQAHAGEEEHAGEDEADPHWWHDPRNAVRAVAAIERALAAADPEGAATYARNADAYTRRIEALDRRIGACLRNVPEHRRKLVTTHDALGYFADRYGIDVVGAVIPSLSTRGQPSAGETARLIDTIRREQVEVVFAESSVDADVEAAVARETGARVGAPLFADTLGPADGPGGTYLASLAANARAIADGLTGRPGACDLGT